MSSPARRAIDRWLNKEISDDELVNFLGKLTYASPTESVQVPGYFEARDETVEDGTWGEILHLADIGTLPYPLKDRASQALDARLARQQEVGDENSGKK